MHPPAASAFQSALANLSPGYFALVMGTGIVSVGLWELGWVGLSRALLLIAATCYVILWVLYVARAIAHRDRVLRDIRDPEQAFAYFTVVAGSDVLAVRFALEGWIDVAVPLLVLGAVLWFVFGYLLPWQVLVVRDGRPILERANGTWFVWAVASQSLAVGAAQIQPHLGPGADWVGMLAVLSWSVGVALYVGVAIAVLLRVIQHGMTPQEFQPSSWVSMGAMAIAVVAGSSIVSMEATPFVAATHTLIAGTVVVFWSFCAWLIPLLVGAGVWRHVVHRVPLTYMSSWWSIVFPVGMFAVASLTMARIDDLPVVRSLGEGGVAVATVLWLVVFVAMLRHVVDVLWRTVRPRASGVVRSAP